jgi:hypothetical protein
MMLRELFVSLCLLVVLFAPLALVLNFALRRLTRMATFWLVLLPLVGTVVLTPLLLWAGIKIVTYYPDREFDAEQWREKLRKRYEFTQDLVESKRLVGRTRADVLRQLGPPEFSPATGDRVGWNAGNSRRFIVGCQHHFVVYFRNDRCIRTETFCED